MRHFCANFYRACGSKVLKNDLQYYCQAFSDKRFARLYNALVTNKKLDACGLEFLNRHIQLRPKWARAYDEDGRRYGQMTSKMAECFNRVLKGVRMAASQPNKGTTEWVEDKDAVNAFSHIH
ncbi:hypothetical protein D1007_07256 [Hordeum vulgare]|nr:hypothetical protein D1007_07256 [Hordeum vulgare]